MGYWNTSGSSEHDIKPFKSLFRPSSTFHRNLGHVLKEVDFQNVYPVGPNSVSIEHIFSECVFFFVILYTLLALLSVYCRCKPTVNKDDHTRCNTAWNLKLYFFKYLPYRKVFGADYRIDVFIV